MWPFSKKEEEPVDNPFVETFPMGTKLNYMGIQMIVCGHWEYMYPLGFYPELICDYVDGDGIIRNVKFNVREINTLKKENNIQ